MCRCSSEQSAAPAPVHLICRPAMMKIRDDKPQTCTTKCHELLGTVVAAAFDDCKFRLHHIKWTALRMGKLTSFVFRSLWCSRT